MIARLVSVHLEFEVMTDDGKVLRHLPVKGVIVEADQINTIPDKTRKAMELLQAQLDAQNATAPGDEPGAG